MTEIDPLKLKKVASFSKPYRDVIEKEGLAFNMAGSWDIVKKDWWFAFVFFLDQAFYTGRRDELSKQFESAAVQALNSVITGTSSDKKLLKLMRLKKWLKPNQEDNPQNPFRKAFNRRYFVNEKMSIVGREKDKKMIIHVLRFIIEQCGSNILEYSIVLISSGRISELYHQLNGIFGIGEKVASLFLSTTVFIYKLDSKLHREDWAYVIPIDIWVQKVANFLGLQADSKSIVDVCIRNKISPILFEQGMWYLGSHSLEVALRTL